MRKKLGTRFPASRIKKIMQADEDVGKIALAVPLLVSKALELFLQDLCDKTYEVTLQRGAKTMNSLHLKQCVKSYSAFDFLSDVVSKIPSLGGPDAFGDQKFTRRRKTSSDDAITENDDDRKCARMAPGDVNIGHRGRGRSRGRGRGRPPGRTAERIAEYEKYEDDISMSPEHDQPSKESSGANANLPAAGSADGTNPPEKPSAEVAVASAPTTELENLMGWAYPETGSIGIEPRNLVNLTVTIDQDEDYDNEE